MNLTKEMNWPDRMPDDGVLELTFVEKDARRELKEPLSDEIFNALWFGTGAAEATDEWRRNMVRIIVQALVLTCHQANQILRVFSWRANRMEAVDLLFPCVYKDLANLVGHSALVHSTP